MRRVRAWLGWLALALPLVAAATSGEAWYNGPLRGQISRSIAQFFGDARGPAVPMGDYQQSMPLLADRFAEVFNEVPGQERVLPDGDVMYDACHAHDCGLAVAVVVGQGRQVIAAAVTHWHCESRVLPAERPAGPDGPARTGGCDDPRYPTLTLFTHGARDPRAIAALADWGRTHLQGFVSTPSHVRVEYRQVIP